jgi:membrane dipeptidase
MKKASAHGRRRAAGCAALLVAQAPNAREVHDRAIVVDTHADTTQRLIFDPNFNIAERHGDGNIDIPRMRDGGMDALFFSIWVPSDVTGRLRSSARSTRSTRSARRCAASRRLCAGDDRRRCAKAVRREENRGADGHVEGGHMIDDDIRQLRNFAALGVRYMTLTHFKNNNWADSSTDKPQHNGLTAFGKDVVAR